MVRVRQAEGEVEGVDAHAVRARALDERGDAVDGLEFQ